MAQDLDIDFENFKVDELKAARIREQVTKLKEESWVEQLQHLVQELGVVDEAALEEQSHGVRKLPGLEKKENLPKVFRVGENHPAEGIHIHCSGLDVSVKFWSMNLLDIQLFPKSQDFIVYNLNGDYWEFLVSLMEALEPEFKQAKSKKAARQGEWKARFANSSGNNLA